MASHKTDSPIYVIETIEAAPNKIEDLRRVLVEVVPFSRKEDGCLLYDLYQDRDHPEKFTVVMCFKNQKSYDQHVEAPYIQKFDSALYSNFVENFYQRIL